MFRTEADCGECGEPFPISQPHCPHCGRPSLFPNVRAATDAWERDELESRYRQACDDLAGRNCDAVRREFENAVLTQARIVLATHFHEVERLASSDNQVFSTYYQLVSAGLVVPRAGKWDVLRGVVEHALFPGYKDNIRFGTLSLGSDGVSNYGGAFLEMKPAMVHHRTSLFEDNNVVFTAYEKRAAMADAIDLDPGHRAAWKDRHLLCVAKLSPRLEPRTSPTDFPSIVLKQGRTTADDRFIEAHVWGSITIRSVERVAVVRRGRRPTKAGLRDLENQLRRFGVPLEVR